MLNLPSFESGELHRYISNTSGSAICTLHSPLGIRFYLQQCCRGLVVALTAQGSVDINPEICGAKLHTHTETPVSSCPVRMPSITDIASTFLATHASVPSVLSFQVYKCTPIFAVAKWPALSPRPTDLNDIGGRKPAETVSCSRESIKRRIPSIT